MIKSMLLALLALLILQTTACAGNANAVKQAKQSAYIVVSANARDKEKLKQYGAAAKPTVLAYGGEFIAKSPVKVLFGDSNYKVKIIIKFPDHASAENWYNSPEYQKLIPLRSEGMDAQFHIVN